LEAQEVQAESEHTDANVEPCTPRRDAEATTVITDRVAAPLVRFLFGLAKNCNTPG